MDARTGEVTSKEALQQRMSEEEFDQFARPVAPKNLSRKRQRELALFGRTKVGRNEKCPCGSGRKFKKCCLIKLGEE